MSKGVNDTEFGRQVVVTVPYKYMSVCVGFLYTVVLRDPYGCGMAIVSRNGMDPSGLASSDVNWMCGSKLLMCYKKLFFSCRIQDHTSAIHIPLPHLWRALGSVDGIYFKVLHEEVGHNGADGRPHGCSLNLFIEPALKLEIGGF